MIFITLQRYDVFCSLTIPLVWHSIYQTFGMSSFILDVKLAGIYQSGTECVFYCFVRCVDT